MGRGRAGGVLIRWDETRKDQMGWEYGMGRDGKWIGVALDWGWVGQDWTETDEMGVG